MICMVKDFKMLSQFIEEIPEAAKDILKYSQKPTTIIYDRPKHMAQNLIANDNTIGIRIVKDEFCFNLIKLLKKPIVSTSANISGLPAIKSADEIEEVFDQEIDYVLAGELGKLGKPTQIKDILTGEVLR